MDYKNDERYWNINLLNKWFAISSILFLISIVWMFLDDNDDEFKVYQRNFRKLEASISKNKLEKEIGDVLWKILEDSANYSFNKSHSIAYASLSAITVFLKESLAKNI